jgi:hypothetical protein
MQESTCQNLFVSYLQENQKKKKLLQGKKLFPGRFCPDATGLGVPHQPSSRVCVV